jgi:hypothetical protein
MVIDMINDEVYFKDARYKVFGSKNDNEDSYVMCEDLGESFRQFKKIIHWRKKMLVMSAFNGDLRLSLSISNKNIKIRNVKVKDVNIESMRNNVEDLIAIDSFKYIISGNKDDVKFFKTYDNRFNVAMNKYLDLVDDDYRNVTFKMIGVNKEHGVRTTITYDGVIGIVSDKIKRISA